MPRPRSIPEDQVLERALLLFWEHGYDRTSIADLSEAIGVGPSSLYNAFGSKAELFRQALARYMQTYARPLGEALDANETADSTLRAFLRGLVEMTTSNATPSGCAVMQGGGAGMPAASEACAITLEIKDEIETLLRKHLEVRKRAGDPLAGTPRTLAKFVMVTMRGLSQLACDGATERELLRVADHAAQSCVAP